MDRVTNLAQHLRTSSLIQDTQGRILDLNTQIASGRTAQEYEGVARDAGRLLSLENFHGRVTQYVDNNNLIEGRLQTMEGNVAQIFDVMSDFKTLLVDALNSDNAADLNMTVQAQDAFNEVAALLNGQLDGRYLFAGSRTDTAPVDPTGLPLSYTVPTTNGASAGYYQGDTLNLQIRAADNFTVTYGVTADELGFEQAIRALDVVIKGAPTDRATLDHALAVTNEALDNIPDIRTAIGLSRETLSETNSKHSDFLLFTEQSIGEIENADIAEVVTKLNEAQTTLDASFLTLSRLNQNTLLNFLR